MDATDSSHLVPIATQCPLIGGAAVYFARNLLYTKFDTLYNVGACPGSGSKEVVPRPLQQLIVYPNPSQNKIHVKGGKKGEQAYMYDRMGQKVLQFHMTEDSKTVDIEHLPDGVYWIRTKARVAKFIKQ